MAIRKCLTTGFASPAEVLSQFHLFMANMQKTSAALLSLLLLSGVTGVFVAAPFYTLYSLDKALDGSPEDLEKHVDFPKLRENMERQLEEYVLAKWQRSGTEQDIEQLVASQLLKALVRGAVERYITPEGLIQLAGRKGDDSLALVTDEILEQLSLRQGRLYELGEKLRIPERLRLRGLSKIRELQNRLIGEEAPLEAPLTPPAGQGEPLDRSQVSFNFISPEQFTATIPVGDSGEISLLLYRYGILKWKLADIALPSP